MIRPVPAALLAGYLILFLVCAVHPYDRAVWWAENIPIVLVAAVLVLVYRKVHLTDLAYVLMSILLYLHTIGGYYTFERVPFGWINHLFGWERNQYDRFAHFSVGFYAYGIADLLLARKRVRSRPILVLFPVFAIFTVAAVYEIVEWLYAAAADPNAGAAFLGSQGDIWDAQKDMLADGCGAILSVCLFWLLRRREIRAMTSPS